MNDTAYKMDTTFRATDTRNKRVIEWISVKDRKPKDGEQVLIHLCILYSAIKGADYADKSFYVLDEDVTKWVTHWASIEQLAPTEF